MEHTVYYMESRGGKVWMETGREYNKIPSKQLEKKKNKGRIHEVYRWHGSLF